MPRWIFGTKDKDAVLKKLRKKGGAESHNEAKHGDGDEEEEEED